MKTIAVIDDDPDIGNMLEELLTREGYRVLRAYSGTEALYLLTARRPDLVLLDLMLPGLSGEELLPKLEGIPVIVVSARAGVSDKVSLLMNGAADYVTKPFDNAELLARIAVQLRSGAQRQNPELLRYGPLELDLPQRTVLADGKQAHLTRTESAILKLLMLNPDQVVTKSVLLDRISEDTPDCMESSLKVHVSNLRRKLRTVSGKDYIEAVWGIGFKLTDE